MRATPPRRASFVGGDRPRVALFFLSVVVLCVFFERAVPPGGWGGGRRVANTLPIPPPRAPREAVVWRHSRDTNTNSETVTRSGVKRRDGKVTGDCRRAGPLESGPSEFIVARPREGSLSWAGYRDRGRGSRVVRPGQSSVSPPRQPGVTIAPRSPPSSSTTAVVVDAALETSSGAVLAADAGTTFAAPSRRPFSAAGGSLGRRRRPAPVIVAAVPPLPWRFFPPPRLRCRPAGRG